MAYIAAFDMYDCSLEVLIKIFRQLKLSYSIGRKSGNFGACIGRKPLAYHN